ncbi:Protein FAM13A isoform 1 [Schistosoma japonicum]|uniref:Protein FAM13A isoform 1 n=1 Tax=Schistosoma japonicum TaxID=6182 RepID=A0A4Z2DVT8_SCHJA|nr:Protein FAM13A isoform 1 [Schistosoma japonicum]
MDRLVRKINISPKSKRKTLIQNEDNFGVPLKVLFDRDSSKPVPRVVKNICNYLLSNGLNSQGIFRINGSAKLIEGFKSNFQISAAEDLHSLKNVDIYALAGVLKLFLRELPDGLVPEKHGLKCIKIAKEYSSDLSVYLLKLQTVLFTLMHENYELLKYLCKFLNKVAENEHVNKMSYNSLGIIFGPCVFRCSLDVQVLKNQGLTNYVMTSLIQHHDAIFVHHPKTDFLVLDRLFKLPEIVSNSALPILEDHIQSSSDISTGFDHNASLTNVSNLQESRVSYFVETSPLAPQNAVIPEPINKVWMSRDCSIESKIPLADAYPNVPSAVYNVAFENTSLPSISCPSANFVSPSQNEEIPISPSTSFTSSPVHFEIPITSIHLSQTNLPSYSEEADIENVSDSGAEALKTQTPEQLALDITNIISSMAASHSLEGLYFKSQSDNYFNTSCHMSNCNEKPDRVKKKPSEKLRVSRVSSDSSNKVLLGDSAFDKMVHFDDITDDYSKLKRTLSHRKHIDKSSDVPLINTWNSLPSVQNKTLKTPLMSNDSCVPTYDKGLCDQFLQLNNVLPNVLEHDSCTENCSPEFDNTYQSVHSKNDGFSTERVKNTPTLTPTSTVPVSTNQFYMEMTAASDEFTKLCTNNQLCPFATDNSLNQLINQSPDTHLFSFSMKQDSHRLSHSGSFPCSINKVNSASSTERDPTPIITEPTLNVLCEPKVPLYLSDSFHPIIASLKSLEGVKSENINRKSLLLRRSFECIAHQPDTVHHLGKSNQSSSTGPMLPGSATSYSLRSNSFPSISVTDKPINQSIDKCKNHGSCCLNSLLLSSNTDNEPLNKSALKFEKLSNELSSLNTSSTFKLVTKQKSPVILAETPENISFAKNDKSNIGLISPLATLAVRRVRSFSSNSRVSSITLHTLLRKYSSVTLDSTCKDFRKNHNADNDGIVLQQSNTSLTSIESFYELLCAVLSEQRRHCDRPECLSEMNWDQIKQEKYDIQKSLLYFESLYGRPKSPKSKRVMKPIYERYRQTKRLISARRGISVSDFPFGMNLSHSKVSTNNSVADINENYTDNRSNIKVSTSTPTSVLHDTFRNIVCDPDYSKFQSLFKNEESNFPVDNVQLSCTSHASGNHNLTSVKNDQNLNFPFKSSHRRSFIRPDDHDIQMYRRQLSCLSPMELYNEKKNILLKKHIVQTELVEYENNIKRLLGRKATKVERQPMRGKYELYGLIKRQLKVVDRCLNLCSSDLINIRYDDVNNSTD